MIVAPRALPNEAVKTCPRPAGAAMKAPSSCATCACLVALRAQACGWEDQGAQAWKNIVQVGRNPYAQAPVTTVRCVMASLHR